MLANFSNLITFSRGSNATVTDASGRLTYAANNLLPSSQDFEAAAWIKGNSTATANTATAPDGTLTADTVQATSGTASKWIGTTATVALGTAHILSFYAKSGTHNFIQITNNGDAEAFANFNLSTGVAGTTGTKTTASIQSVGNGWYRCTALFSATVAYQTGHRCYLVPSASATYAQALPATGAETIFLWGAQLEAVTYQTTPSPYVSTSVANLLGFSEDFTNAAWTKSNSAIVPGAAQNPINNLWNAQKLMENSGATGNKQVFQTQTLSAASRYTLSVYAKASERPGVILSFGSTSPWGGTGDQREAAFNLSTGTVISSTGSVTATITAIGNGWYRCAVQSPVTTASASSFPVVRLCDASGSPSYTGDGNSGIYIYGAQLSNSGSLDPYVPTPGAAPSSTAYYGPRFDYDPVTLAAKGILIEEQRTNLLTYSNTFNNAAWAWASGATGTLSQNVLSPDGSVNAWTIADTDNAAAQLIQQSATLTAVTHTFSCYFKKTTGAQSTYPVLLVVNGGNLNGAVCTVDTTNGVATVWTAFTGWTIVTSTATCTDAGAYWRVSLTFLGQSAGFLMRIAPAGTSNPTQSTGTLATNLTGSTVIYGAQLEAGAFATSYIPTVASQVTRTADVASISGSLFNGWYNQDQGTITFSGTSLTVSGFSYAALASDTTNNNRFGMYRSSATFSGLAVSGGVTQMDIAASSATANVPFKMAVAAQANNGNFCFNNVLGTTDTSVTMPTVTRLDIGCFGSGSQFNGYIQNITYYPTRLTNDQLQAITK